MFVLLRSFQMVGASDLNRNVTMVSRTTSVLYEEYDELAFVLGGCIVAILLLGKLYQ